MGYIGRVQKRLDLEPLDLKEAPVPEPVPFRCAQCLQRTDVDGRHLTTGAVACEPVTPEPAPAR